jgi:hypothetical protein
MQGRDFLDVTQSLVSGPTEPYWRAAVIHSYYSLFLECRAALARWGIAIVPRPNAHSAVRLRFIYVRNSDLKRIGFTLDIWCQRRNEASYDLGFLPDFATDALAKSSITEVSTALALLDAIEADLVRRAAAIASFPP